MSFPNKIQKIVTLLLLMLFISNISMLFIQADAGGSSVTYSGYVRDANSNPISGATVRLSIDDDGTLVYRQTTTAANGYYSVTCPYDSATPPVAIALSASKTGYIFSSYGANVYPGSYTHDFTLQEDTPTLSWVSPGNNQLITFSPSSNLFSFTYSASLLDYVRLYIGPAGEYPTTQFGGNFNDMGSSVSKAVDLGDDTTTFHGLVRADLRGYKSSSMVIEATRTFNFSKQISIVISDIENGIEDLGSKLYLILYDPPGDGSYSTFTQTTEVKRTNTFGLEVGIGIEVELTASLFNVGTDAKFGLNFEYGFEYEWAQTDIDTLSLTSSLNEINRELIGPGYGDLYWGEREVLIWVIKSTNTTYADGTMIYSEPRLCFGIDYSENVLVSHINAPASWKLLNPNVNTVLYDDPTIVDLEHSNYEFEGGTGSIEVTHERISSKSITHSFSFEVSYETKVKLGIGATTISGSLTTQFKHNEEYTNSISTSYHLQDDDSGDYFHYDVGTDKRFGVPIFRNTPNDNPLLQSKSSNPWEYNTRDYLPPENTYPVITLNTDGDEYYPSSSDTPLVELKITDEDAVAVARLIYSPDNGDHWYIIELTERLNDLDSWYGNIPSYPHETVILWYIYTEDHSGNSKEIKDVDNNYFSYTIVNRPPAVILLSPDVGGTYQNSILIEWAGSDPDGDSLTYTIGYRIGSGGWTLIVQGLTNTSYIWDISQFPDSDSVSIIVYAYDGFGGVASVQSSFVFSIDNIDIPTAAFTSPLSSFIYQGIITVTWSTFDPDNFVTGYKLYYSITSGTPSWILIDDAIAKNLLTFDWNSSSIVYSTTTRLKIVVLNSLDETVETISGIFTIDNRPTMQMNLISPNGGEIITDSWVINWNLDYDNDLIDYQIKLEYSYNSSDWVLIISGITGTSYYWNTSALPAGTNYRIRITLTASYLGFALNPISDISESTFAIVKPTTTIIPTTTPTSVTNVPMIVSIIVLVTMTFIPFIKNAKKIQKEVA